MIKQNGKEVNLNCIDTSAITDMSHLFEVDADRPDDEIFLGFNGDISEWDVSNVTNMSYMFATNIEFECQSRFNGDLSKWDVSNVTDMTGMFYQACCFNQDISKWDVSKVRYMDDMFHGADVFNQDLNDWNVSNVESMSYMFACAYAFNGKISSWDVRNVEDMSSMFAESKAFMSDISAWNVSADTRRAMFDDIPYFPIDFMPGLNNKKIFLTKGGEKCKIRQATLEDSQFIAKGISATIGGQGVREDILRHTQTKDTLYYFGNALIAEINGSPVGCVLTYTGEYYQNNYYNTWTRRIEAQAEIGEFHIDSLYVEPDYRKQSIARHLLDIAIETNNMLFHCRKVSLVIMPNETDLVSFYEKNGFKNAGYRNLWDTSYILMTK